MLDEHEPINVRNEALDFLAAAVTRNARGISQHDRTNPLRKMTAEFAKKSIESDDPKIQQQSKDYLKLMSRVLEYQTKADWGDRDAGFRGRFLTDKTDSDAISSDSPWYKKLSSAITSDT